MELTIALLVLVGAAMSAGMHAFIKIGTSRFLMFCGINVIAAIPAVAMVMLLPPISAEAWMYVPASMLMHHGQKICLLLAYGAGDLSRIYPIMRGSAPLVVAGFAVVFLDEALGLFQIGGLLLITAGLLYLAVSGVDFRGINRRATIFAFAAGLFTAGYTVVDGMGARVAGSPVTFIAWLYVLDAIPFTTYALLRLRTELLTTFYSHLPKLIIAGLMSIASYGIIVFALTRAPMGPVAALKEVSVIFGAIIGVIWLREPFGTRRLASAVLIAIGIGALIVGK